MPTITINNYVNTPDGSTSPTGHVNVTISDGSTTFTFGGNINFTSGGGVFAESFRPGGTTSTQNISQAGFDAVLAWANTEIAQTSAGQESYGVIGGNCVDVARMALEIAGAATTAVSQLMAGSSLAKSYAVISDFVAFNGGLNILAAAGELTGGIANAGIDLGGAFSAAGSALSSGNIVGAVSALFEGAMAAAGDILEGLVNTVRSFLEGPLDYMDTRNPPIVIDLSGAGIKFTPIHDSHATLHDDDGSAQHVSWVSSGVILAFDKNHNGAVDGLGEISLNRFSSGSTSDLDGLKHFDSNADGLLSSADAEFANFIVWNDANGNGVSDPGETMSLAAANIASINLAGTGNSFVSGGNFVQNTTTVTMADGSQHDAYDVVLVGHQAPDVPLAA